MNCLDKLQIVSATNNIEVRSYDDYLVLAPSDDAGSIEVTESTQIVAVYEMLGLTRLWQSIYAETDCSDASSVWLIGQDGSFVRLIPEKKAMPIAVRLKSRSIIFHTPLRAEMFSAYPHMDVVGNRFMVNLSDDHEIENALAAFYWHTLIPCVIEGKNASYPDGYVLSTLAQSVYAGTYPDVDHEFQCKGRIAGGGKFDLHLVRRMIELQLRLMEEDPVKLWRNPCALQPNGIREYHVRRNSSDNRTNADMFLISGNVEVLESTWLLIARSKDTSWLSRHIGQLEGAASLLEHCIDQYGRLWSDVFYEDQIIKDGMECLSACLAANGLRKLAELEELLDRQGEAQHYHSLEKQLAGMIVKPVPYGFWDAEHARFIDWLDRDGVVHDHIHLLANCLPVLFDYCTQEQKQACMDIIQHCFEEYQRFPTFLSPAIQDYTASEIGVPYDLCAAGRYWCWDAAYWNAMGRGDVLRKQVHRVSQQAKTDHFEMGERYDMNYIYYIDDKNWHGAARYYEYPCVYWWVVIHELLGIGPSLPADLCWRPLLNENCDFALDAWGIRCQCAEEGFAIANLSHDKELMVEFDGSAIWKDPQHRLIHLDPGEEKMIRQDK